MPAAPLRVLRAIRSPPGQCRVAHAAITCSRRTAGHGGEFVLRAKRYADVDIDIAAQLISARAGCREGECHAKTAIRHCF